MDGLAFDRLTRTLSTGTTRRLALGGAFTVALGRLGFESETEAGGRNPALPARNARRASARGSCLMVPSATVGPARAGVVWLQRVGPAGHAGCFSAVPSTMATWVD